MRESEMKCWYHKPLFCDGNADEGKQSIQDVKHNLGALESVRYDVCKLTYTQTGRHTDRW